MCQLRGILSTEFQNLKANQVTAKKEALFNWREFLDVKSQLKILITLSYMDNRCQQGNKHVLNYQGLIIEEI